MFTSQMIEPDAPPLSFYPQLLFSPSSPTCYRPNIMLLLLSLFFSNIFPFHLLLILSSPPPQPSDIEFRVGRGQRWNQEDTERRAARRERKSRPRQIQNAATDPTGQHQAADRRVWVHVRAACLSLRRGRPVLNSTPSGRPIYMDNWCRHLCYQSPSMLSTQFWEIILS